MLIPTKQEIANSLNGTLMLAKRDRGGVSWLDGSVDGFWKSFFAAVIFAPFYILMLWFGRYSNFPDADLTSVVLIESMAYICGWLLWPVIAREICRLIDPALDVRTYIVACNWSELWIIFIRLPLLFLMSAEAFAQPLLNLLSLFALLAIFYYRYIIARETLPATNSIAMGLAAADMILGIFWRNMLNAVILPYAGVPFGAS